MMKVILDGFPGKVFKKVNIMKIILIIKVD